MNPQYGEVTAPSAPPTSRRAKKRARKRHGRGGDPSNSQTPNEDPSSPQATDENPFNHSTRSQVPPARAPPKSWAELMRPAPPPPPAPASRYYGYHGQIPESSGRSAPTIPWGVQTNSPGFAAGWDDDDEWEYHPSLDSSGITAAPFVAASGREPPHLPVDLGKVAEDASILLELFSKTKPDDDEDIDNEHTQLIDSALKSILKIQTELRVIAARKNRSIESLEPPALETDDTNIDAACIICYSEISDVVFIPCKHLAVCTVGLIFSARARAHANKHTSYAAVKWG